jgi:hypothetical protein
VRDGSIDRPRGLRLLPRLAIAAAVATLVVIPAPGVADSSPTTAATAAVRSAASPMDLSILPSDRRTTWKPGLPGGVPPVTTIHTTIDATTLGNGITDATAAINDAIQAAGRVATPNNPRVVYLPAGVYRITNTVVVDRSYVVLRGAGKRKTIIRMTGGQGALVVGRLRAYTGAVSVAGSVPKGAVAITVVDAHKIQSGDVLQIDQLEDGDALGTRGWVWRFDSTWFMRGPRGYEDTTGPDSPSGYRAIGQQIEIASKSGNTLNLANTIHIAFAASQSPQVFHTATAREGQPGTRYSGIEDLTAQGGTNSMFAMLNAAYCWLRNVESDGSYPTFVGTHIPLFHCYRCEVRDSYVHHSSNYYPGGAAYGISIGGQSTDCLVENCIVYMLNKPILGRATGGGNVIGYNYVDEAILGSPTNPWQETAIDASHASFSHWDLYEGNLAPNIGTDSTHGNNGWIVFFRNWAFGRNTSGHTSGNLRAIGIDGWNRQHTSIGNVLLQPGMTTWRPSKAGGGSVLKLLRGAVRDSLIALGLWSPAAIPSPVRFSISSATLDNPAAYRIGTNCWDRNTALGPQYGRWDDGTALRLFHPHMDFDYATNSVFYNPENLEHTLPASLYLEGKPAFFGNLPWPWVDPLGTPRVHTLPAKARFEAGTP